MNNITAKFILKSDCPDKILKEEIEKLFFNPIETVYVLPNQIERVKNMLQGLTIKVGSVIDYPLNIGTIPKIAFETLDLFNKGARSLLLSISLTRQMISNGEYLHNLEKTIKPITFFHGEIIYLFDISSLSEAELIDLAKTMTSLAIKKIAIQISEEMDAMHILSLFRYEGDPNLKILVIIEKVLEFSSDLLIKSGADKVGLIVV